MASLVPRGRLSLRSVQCWAATAWCQGTGSWTDRITVPQWVLSEVAWWASPAVLQGLPLATRETEVTLFTHAFSSGWGAQLGSRSTQGQWSASQRSWHINVLEMQSVTNAVRDFLLHLRSRVVHLMCNNAVTGLHQERGRHTIIHTHADDDTPAQMVRSQGDHVGSRPSTRSPQHPGRFPVQSRPDTEHGVDDDHGATPSGASHRSTCLRHSPTNDSSSLLRRIRTLGPSSRMPCQCPGTTGQREGPPVCIPAIQDGPSSAAEDRSVARSQGDSDRSTAGGSFMVSGVDGSVTRRSHPTVRRGSTTADSRCRTDRWGDRDLSLPAIKSTHVETLWAILMTKDHSREAAHMMSRALRDSFQVYESHWARFVSFCRSKCWHVFRVRSHHFSTYMMHLFRDGLLPSTIISHYQIYE